jgi:hypothetical protein
MGIKGVVTLPQIDLRNDIDNPSVYLGGNGSGHEIDAGLSWSQTSQRYSINS